MDNKIYFKSNNKIYEITAIEYKTKEGILFKSIPYSSYSLTFKAFKNFFELFNMKYDFKYVNKTDQGYDLTDFATKYKIKLKIATL